MLRILVHCGREETQDDDREAAHHESGAERIHPHIVEIVRKREGEVGQRVFREFVVIVAASCVAFNLGVVRDEDKEEDESEEHTRSLHLQKKKKKKKKKRESKK